MKELSAITSNMGLTEETYRNVPVGRRTLFKLVLSLPIVIACSRSEPQATVEPLLLEPTGGIRHEIGVWTPLEVANLAKEMLDDGTRGLNNTAFAGAVLLDNQRGIPGALARMSPLFEEGRIKVETVPSISGNTAEVDLPAPASAVIRTKGRMDLNLRSRIGEPTLRMAVPTTIHFEIINFGYDYTKDMSDMMVKFYMAKELFNARAFEMASNYAMVGGLTPYYEIPSNERAKKALQLGLLDGGMGQSRMRVAFVADLWSHFLLVPDYLKAIENGLFTQDEIDSPGLGAFKLAVKVFQEEKVITKNSSGDYEWTKDNDKFFDSWYRLAEAGHRVFGKSSPRF